MVGGTALKHPPVPQCLDLTVLRQTPARAVKTFPTIVKAKFAALNTQTGELDYMGWPKAAVIPDSERFLPLRLLSVRGCLESWAFGDAFAECHRGQKLAAAAHPDAEWLWKSWKSTTTQHQDERQHNG